MKFALLSISLPPIADGQAMMLRRILASIDPRDYCLISRNAIGLLPSDPAYTEKLPVPYYSLDDVPLTSDPLWWRRLKSPFRIFHLARRIAEDLQHFGERVTEGAVA